MRAFYKLIPLLLICLILCACGSESAPAASEATQAVTEPVLEIRDWTTMVQPSADTLQQEVMQEPRMALDGGADGLDFYRRIALDAPAHLNPNGLIAVEVGIGEADDVAALFTAAGLRDVRIINDLYGVARIVSAFQRSENHV